MNGIPDLRSDPAFIRVVTDLSTVHAERIAELKATYGIVGLNELGGDVRPALRLCNMRGEHMFDGREPEVGDIVSIGHVYGDDESTVLIGRLARHHGNYADWPACPKLGPSYRFAWSVDPICEHVFASRRPQAGRRPA